MRKSLKLFVTTALIRPLLVATFGLALAFILSCSSDDGTGNNPANSSNEVEAGCENFVSDPSDYFCYENKVYAKCNGEEYDPSTYVCQGLVASAKCTFCYESNVYAKCNGKVYNPSTHICQDLVVRPAICNGIPYNSVREFCYNDSKISNLCGVNPQTYNPDLYECKGGRNGIYLKDGITDTRDSKIYEAVLIGTQIWMAENLNYQTSYYDWFTANTICPSGWHLPSSDEWTNLTNFAGSTTKLMATSDLWKNGNKGTDDYGFAALPGGIYCPAENYIYFDGDNGYWWGVSESANSACGLHIGSAYVGFVGVAEANCMIPVRCVKDY